MIDEYSAPVPLKPWQKRAMRIGLTVYLVFMSLFTLLSHAFGPAAFYAILLTVDSYVYMDINRWVKIKKGKKRR